MNLDQLNDRFYGPASVNMSVASSSMLTTDRLKKRFILDDKEIMKRSKILEGLRNSPERILKVTEIADSFEKLTNS